MEREGKEVRLGRVFRKEIVQQASSFVRRGRVYESVDGREGRKSETQDTVGTIAECWILSRGNVQKGLRSYRDPGGELVFTNSTWR